MVSQLEDWELLDQAIKVAKLLATEAFGERLNVQDSPSEFAGWDDSTRPVRLELQLLVLARPAKDSLSWGATAALEELGPTTLGTLRFLVETAAIMAWLVEPPTPDARQRRSIELLNDQLARERRMLERIAERELDREKRAADQRSIDTLAGRANFLVGLALEDDPGPLGRVPKRDEIFDRFAGSFGGYGFFSMVSEFGGHPGFALEALIEGQRQRNATIYRAYMVRGQLLAAREIVRILSQVFGWRLDDELGVYLRLSDAVCDAVGTRFSKDAWG